MAVSFNSVNKDWMSFIYYIQINYTLLIIYPYQYLIHLSSLIIVLIFIVMILVTPKVFILIYSIFLSIPSSVFYYKSFTTTNKLDYNLRMK